MHVLTSTELMRAPWKFVDQKPAMAWEHPRGNAWDVFRTDVKRRGTRVPVKLEQSQADTGQAFYTLATPQPAAAAEMRRGAIAVPALGIICAHFGMDLGNEAPRISL